MHTFCPSYRGNTIQKINEENKKSWELIGMSHDFVSQFTRTSTFLNFIHTCNTNSRYDMKFNGMKGEKGSCDDEVKKIENPETQRNVIIKENIIFL